MPLYGPKFPLSKGNYDTFEVYDNLSDQISFFLKNLILTSPGENISDPNYGVGIRRYLFEQETGGLLGEISSEISRQIAIYMPYLIVNQVFVDASGSDIDSNTIVVSISYSINQVLSNQVFELNINPDASIGFY